jgi:hypothetical protein
MVRKIVKIRSSYTSLLLNILFVESFAGAFFSKLDFNGIK